MFHTQVLALIVLVVVVVTAGVAATSSSSPVTETTDDLKPDSSSGLAHTHFGNFGHYPGKPNRFYPSLPPPQGGGDIRYPYQNMYSGPPPCTCNPYLQQPPIDPFLLHLLGHYMRYLPYGLGPQGFYGSTGLPPVKPPGVFRASEKLDSKL